MRTNWTLKLLACALFVQGVAFTEEPQEKKSQTIELDKERSLQPLDWIIWKDQVKTDDLKIYEKKITQIIDKAKKQASFLRVLTFFEEATSTYYFFYPYKTVHDWNQIYSFWSKEAKSQETKKNLISYSISLAKSEPELSQIPPSGKVSLANPNYIHMEHFEILPSSEEKFISYLKQWKEMVKNKAPDCGWFVQKSIVGEHLPTYTLLWGDCLKNQETVDQLDKFLLSKEAYGVVVKKVVSEDKIYVPELSTAKLNFTTK